MKDVKALIIQADGKTEARDITPDATRVSAIVGGWLEGVGSTIDADWHAYVDEEGRIKRLPVNEVATALAHRLGWPGDFLVGTVVFLGQKGTEEADVPQHVIDKALALR